MFGTYVSPAVVGQLVKSGQPPRLGGHEEEITAYFSDIQGFSRFAELMPPERLVELMNEYLTACTDVVTEEGGTLDKYIGDAVVAMFGAPIAQRDHAYRACLVALRVQARLAELRAKWREEGDRWPAVVAEMQTRIGLNSGPCVIGNMGSRTRFNYTMMGDNVNLAARMESGAKSWGVFTLCTEATRRACEQHAGDRVVFRPLGKIRVIGRAKPVAVFEVIGAQGGARGDDARMPRHVRRGAGLLPRARLGGRAGELRGERRARTAPAGPRCGRDRESFAHFRGAGAALRRPAARRRMGRHACDDGEVNATRRV